MDVAFAFLSERPFRELTVARLMEGTSVGRSTFYIHFRDLYELAGALLEVVDEELERVTRAGRAAGVFPRELRVMVDNVVAVWQRYGPVIGAIRDASRQDARLEALYRGGFTQRAIDRVRSAIQLGQRDGNVDPAFDAMELATLLVLMNERYLTDRFGGRSHADPEVARRTLVLAWERIFGTRH